MYYTYLFNIFYFPINTLNSIKKDGGGTLDFAVILSILRIVPLNKYIMDK